MQPSRSIHDVLGLSNLSDEEREVFLAEVGETVIESALLKFTLDLGEQEHGAFETFLAEAGVGEELMMALIEKYPAFADTLASEMQRFRDEAVEVLGDGAVNVPDGAGAGAVGTTGEHHDEARHDHAHRHHRADRSGMESE